MPNFARIVASATIAALAFLIATQPATSAEALTGKMAMYGDLVGSPWTCTLGGAAYSAAYSPGPGNTLYGHLYTKDSSEDEYFGYDAKRNLYWVASVDSGGSTESQTSADGVTYVGMLNAGGATANATNVYTLSGSHKWTVRARGSMGGSPYDVLATCVRN